ncbi:nucleotidyl transferase AbiEii/AbiGii toxin family protein [Chitinophaga sp. 22321]|uniref:nucleotidyl transferase AbiEii/AbiGii toxin family protein n=1 Tax=Chitinophaga TaxID=79328 RepID=UPI003F6A1140
MNMPADKSLIEEIATEMNISSSFVEKDWYVTQIIKIVAGLTYEDFEIVFTGGTALSKAHKLLQRFSEDTDFRVTTNMLFNKSKNQQRVILSGLKKTLEAALQEAFPYFKLEISAGNDNYFMIMRLSYPSLFSKSEVLRPHLLLELTITTLALPTIHLPVSSLINEVLKRPAEVESIPCTNPVENASDKLSALLWRIPHRDRSNADDAPTIVRHIHDLAILTEIAINHGDFKNLATTTILHDEKRSPKVRGLTLSEKFSQVQNILRKEIKEYNLEYTRFVQGMSYAPHSKIPSFADAMKKFNTLAFYVQ